jgi:hypothetical protein
VTTLATPGSPKASTTAGWRASSPTCTARRSSARPTATPS